MGRTFHARTGLPLGALNLPQPKLQQTSGIDPDEVLLAVVGAHLSGMALNQELTTLGGRFIEDVRTTPDYRLFALEASEPARPGLLRVAGGEGAPIEAEIWALSHEAFGIFVASVPAPLSIGTLRFDNGSQCKGFLVEAEATRNARDISSLGGWRAYIASKLKSA